MTLPPSHPHLRPRSWVPFWVLLPLLSSLLSGLSVCPLGPGQSAQAQAVPQTVEAAARQDEADRLLREGVQAYSASQFATALARWQAALAIYEELGDRPGRTVALTNLGEAHRSLGQYAEAVAAFAEALSIAQETGDSRGDRFANRRRQGLILGNLGITYYATGDYTLALENLQQAQTIAQELGDREGVATALLNQAVVYRALGQPDEADRRVRQAQTVGGEADVAPQPSSATIAQLEQELRMAQAQGDRQGEAALQGAIGVLLLNQRQYDRAIAAMQSQLDIAREIGDRPLEATALNNLGLLYVELQDYPQAMDMLQDSLLVKQEIGDREGEARTLANLGRLFLEQDQPAMAIVFLKRAVNLWEALRAGLQQSNPDIQQTYTDRFASTYRLLADLLLRQDRVLEAQQVLDLLKVQELDDYLRDVRGNEQTGRGIALSEEERNMLSLYDRAIAQGRELARLRAIAPERRTPAQQQRLTVLVAAEQNLARTFDDFLNRPEVVAALDQLSRTTRRQNIDPIQFTALQDNLRNLNQNAVLLYPLVLDDRLELILVTPFSPPIRRTVNVPRAQLNRAILELRQSLTDIRVNPRPSAERLYDWLVRPLEADLAQANAQTIVYAPDGQLRYIPLAALHDGTQWLVQRYRVNYITAASLTEFDRRPQRDLRVLAGAFVQGEVSVRVGAMELRFPGLPFAGIEVENIAAQIPNTQKLIDAQFSPQATIPRMNDYTVVHLATHAQFVAGSPEETFIVFGNGDRVTLQDASRWSLPNVELIVLSACQTAMSGESNGEEILGFGFQMQRTGARAAIASLWRVNDEGTEALMTQFYRLLNQKTISKAEALQQAQISLIQDNQPPFFWAPFILIGNGL